MSTNLAEIRALMARKGHQEDYLVRPLNEWSAAEIETYKERLLALPDVATPNPEMADIRMARPVAVVDVWDMDDRIARLEALANRFEALLIASAKLHDAEGARDWEQKLQMLDKRGDNEDRAG